LETSGAVWLWLLSNPRRQNPAKEKMIMAEQKTAKKGKPYIDYKTAGVMGLDV
jgi:hypothetical protein